jgi:hypothetical protein
MDNTTILKGLIENEYFKKELEHGIVTSIADKVFKKVYLGTEESKNDELQDVMITKTRAQLLAELILDVLEDHDWGTPY